MWIFYAFLSAVTAALVAVFAKLGLKNIDTVLATAIRSVIMAVLLVVTSLFLKKFNNFSFASLGSREWSLIILAGVAGALSWLFYFLALKTGLTTHVAAIDRLSVVFVVLFAALFLGEALDWHSVVGALLMIGGAILMILK